MAALSSFKAFCLTHFSKPASDRVLYRLIEKHKVRRILELGLGDACRAVRMIEMAQRCSPEDRIAYTGTDLFEGRGETEGAVLTLKEVYQRLGATGAKIRLVPGDSFTALSRTANGLTDTDLVVISASETLASVERAWFYLPRVIHERSIVVREELRSNDKLAMRVLESSEIAKLARVDQVRRAA